MIVDTDWFPVRRLPSDETVTAATAALIIIDMMNSFCDPQWLGGGNPENEEYFRGEFSRVIPNLQGVLAAFRDASALVVHVVNAKWTLDAREAVPYQHGRDYDLFDTPRMSVVPELQPIDGEIIARKVASSAFMGTGLEYMLRNAGIENVAIAGQYGNACCFYSLIHSREAGFNNIWLEDGLVYGSETYKQLFQAIVGANWARLATCAEVSSALTN